MVRLFETVILGGQFRHDMFGKSFIGQKQIKLDKCLVYDTMKVKVSYMIPMERRSV